MLFVLFCCFCLNWFRFILIFFLIERDIEREHEAGWVAATLNPGDSV